MLRTIIIITALLIAGCVKRDTQPLLISGIPTSEGGKALLDHVRVRVLPFADARDFEAIGRIDESEVDPEGKISTSVQLAFERELRKRGGQAVLFEAAAINGDVIEWYVNVDRDFPVQKATAAAKILVRVLDDNDKPRFVGEYGGEVSVQHPLISKEKIEETLGSAMSYAIDEALSDSRLIAAINR